MTVVGREQLSIRPSSLVAITLERMAWDGGGSKPFQVTRVWQFREALIGLCFWVLGLVELRWCDVQHAGLTSVGNLFDETRGTSVVVSSLM